jgi:O-glycosyl hydrolase
MFRKAIVDFTDIIRTWDGFGVNYVETSQTQDYTSDPQDYGGFSILSEEDRRKVIELTFGDDGLKPGLVKMFLGPFHQDEPSGDYAMNDPKIDMGTYDHERSTQWMRKFAREGLELTRGRGRDLEIIATLYGPPAWMTKQRIWRGRDMDPERKVEVAKYIVSFAKYLREAEGLPVGYVSLHNEGEDWTRWADDGTTVESGHDFNLYWPPELVAEFMRLMREVLAANDLEDVSVTPGETSNWLRFVEWGYAWAIANDPDALAKMGLITSHGFWSPGFHRWAGDWRSTGIDMIRAKRPELRAWVTSSSWAKMDIDFVAELRESIYCAKVNGIIPWACIQRSGLWKGGDPNPGTAFRVHEDGTFTVEAGYWWYKGPCRAGQPGTGVARATCNDTQVSLMAFADNGSDCGDAFVVTNTSDESKEATVELIGASSHSFDAWRTSDDEQYAEAGRFTLADGRFVYNAPPRSATSFFVS